MPNGNGGKRGNPTFRGMQQKVGTININLQELESATCPACNAVIFDTGFMTYKRLPAIQSPNGKSMLLAIPIIVCVNCDSLFTLQGDQLSPVNPEGTK